MNKKFSKAILLSTVVIVGVAVCFISNSNFRLKISSKMMSNEFNEEREEKESMEGMAKYINALRANPITGTVSEQEYLRALNASNLISTKRSVSMIWNSLGPDNVGGRTRAFLQDHDTPSIMYSGSVSGGLFRSTTKGASWVPVNDYLENLNVVSIAQNSNRVIVYGTGEGQFVQIDGSERGTPGFAGYGIFRSVNSGFSFTKVNHPDWGNISSIASEPKSIGSRFYASTDNGVKYSDDGLTWTTGKVGVSKEVKVGPDGTVYAQIGSSLWKSSDRGVNWTNVTPPGSSVSRLSIAVSPQDANYVYTMVSNAGGGFLDGVYRSVNAGLTWEKIITGSINFFDPLSATAQNPQGGYNNVISVDPRNKDLIYMGGVTFAKWQKGNNPQVILNTSQFDANGRIISNYVHSDKHVIEWDMSTNPPTIMVGSDGGLFFSQDNLATFTPKNFDYSTFQAYAVAADYNGNSVGGAQDNGTQYINKKGNTPRSSVQIKGGDGFQVEISTKLSNVIFSESQYGNLTRSRDYGKSQSCIWDRRIARSFIGLTDTNKFCDQNHSYDWAPFNMMFKLWENPVQDSTQSRLFIAKNNQIWMADNATDVNTTPVWYMISSSVAANVWDIEVTPDGNSVFVTSDGSLKRIDGLNSAVYNKWSNPLSIPPGITTTNLNITNAAGRAVCSVNLNPNNSNEALITLGSYGYSNYVIKGTNMLGAPVYTNITNNLPPMPVYDGVIAYSSSNLMFLGTDLGVYASDDGGATWTAQTNTINKFPKVATFALRQYYFPDHSKGALYAGTHGRGFFSCTQYQTSIQPTKVDKASSSLNAYPNPASDFVNLKYSLNQNEEINCSILDVSGKVVKTIALGMQFKGENNFTIETKDMVAGIYFVTVKGPGTTKPKGTVKLILTH